MRQAAEVRERPMTAMGLLGLVSAALLMAGLILGGWRWAYALEALGALILGVLLIGAYYRFRKDEDG